MASPRKRLKHSPVSSGDGSPRYGGGADPPLQDAGGHRERGGGRARRPKAAHDPLAVWFEHHFALLDKARECYTVHAQPAPSMTQAESLAMCSCTACNVIALHTCVRRHARQQLGRFTRGGLPPA